MSRPIGLIGLGLMGSALAERLVSSNYVVLGWDLDECKHKDLASIGGIFADHPEQVFSECDYVLLSLPHDGVVREVLERCWPRLRSGQFVIDTSTGNPDSIASLAATLEEAGVAYLDATVSGSSAQVRDGSATAMVGATEQAMKECHPLLNAVIPKVLHVGPPGCGAKMKLLTNLVLGLNRAALAEGLIFAQSLGLPLDDSLAVLKSGMAYSRIMDTKGSKMIAREFTPQAKLDQHTKDVRLMLDSARASNTELPLTQTHFELLQRASQMGYGEADNSAIIEAFRSAKRIDENKA